MTNHNKRLSSVQSEQKKQQPEQQGQAAQYGQQPYHDQQVNQSPSTAQADHQRELATADHRTGNAREFDPVSARHEALQPHTNQQGSISGNQVNQAHHHDEQPTGKKS